MSLRDKIQQHVTGTPAQQKRFDNALKALEKVSGPNTNPDTDTEWQRLNAAVESAEKALPAPARRW